MEKIDTLKIKNGVAERTLEIHLKNVVQSVWLAALAFTGLQNGRRLI